jgi:hypothetical protein
VTRSRSASASVGAAFRQRSGRRSTERAALLRRSREHEPARSCRRPRAHSDLAPARRRPRTATRPGGAARPPHGAAVEARPFPASHGMALIVDRGSGTGQFRPAVRDRSGRSAGAACNETLDVLALRGMPSRTMRTVFARTPSAATPVAQSSGIPLRIAGDARPPSNARWRGGRRSTARQPIRGAGRLPIGAPSPNHRGHVEADLHAAPMACHLLAQGKALIPDALAEPR